MGVVVIAAVVALVAMSGTKKASAIKPVPTTTTATTTPPAPTCPLTGTPAPGGTVPARPALGVKIGNYPDDRPSAGLNNADIVFEEPVEGAITRLVAIFQCQAPSLVGDLRSAREPDVAIMSQLSKPIFAHAGGIDPILQMLQTPNIIDENVLTALRRPSSSNPAAVAPYSTFTNTASLWALDPSDTTPPAPIFTYSTIPPAGSVAGSGDSAHIPFSSTSDVTWTWNPSATNYLRSYATGGPDILIDGSQTAANNVVIMTVQTNNGPWYENSEGGLEVEVTATGSGPLVVLRNGVAITGTWQRSSITQPATLTAANGTPITLTPGNTWEELVPAGIPVTTTAGPATPLPKSTTTTTSAKKTAADPAKQTKG